MCGGSQIRDALESIASVAGNYVLPGSSLITDNLVSKGAQNQLSSPIGEIANIGSGLAGGGVLGSGLQSAGGAAEQGLISGAGNSLEGALGLDTTGPGVGDVLSNDASSIGNSLSNGANALSQDLGQFTQASGLSSLFGGTAAPTSGLDAAYNGIQSAAASPDLASASQIVSPGVQGAVGGAPGVAGAGGGSIAGLGGISGTGSDLSGGLSSTGLGGNAAILGGDPNAISNQFSIGGLTPSAPATAESALSSSTALPAVPDLSGIAGSPISGLAGGEGGPQGGGNILSNLFSPSVPQGSFNYDINGNPVGGSAGNLSNNFSVGAGMPSIFSGGTATQPSAGANITNSLLRGGLGYLLNSPNTAGANAINNATQQAQAGFSPYTQAGQGAENTLAALYGNNGTQAQQVAEQNFQNTPGYQFALNQGINAVNANAAAMGQPLSGNNEQAVNNYAQGTANQTYNNYVNQLQNLASGGLSAAGGSGTAGLTGGAAIAQLDQNKANAANTAIGTGLQGLFPTGGLDLAQLLNGQGGGGNNNGLLSLLGIQ